MKLSGIIAAMITPIKADLTIDSERLVDHARDLLARGGSRVSTFGSTGEGVSFAPSAKRDAIGALLSSGVRVDQLLPAVMTPSVEIAARELTDLAQFGCQEALVLPPFYYPDPPLQGLISFYEAIYEKAGRPDISFVLYNIPTLSGVTISHDLIRALQSGAGANIAGVKDSTGNLESGTGFVEAFRDLAIFTGDDRVLPHLLRVGGAGMIGGMPNLYIEDLVALCRDPDGPDAPALAALAAERIARIDSTGGLLALKAAVATKRNDSEWRRAMPPLDGGFRTRAGGRPER